MIFKALTFSLNLVSENIQKKKEMVWELQHEEIWKRKTDQQKELASELCGKLCFQTRQYSASDRAW